MFLTIVYRLPGLPGAVTTACKALLWAVALLTALSLVVAVCMAVAPYLPQLMIAMSVIMAYALATMPQAGKAAL